MNEFEIRDELREKRKSIESFEDLTAFLKDVEENYNTDYGGAPRAIAQASLAVAQRLAGVFGITGFQASFVMWEFIHDWSYSHNKTGMRIMDYDDMLYPQYAYKFEKIISSRTWADIQNEAKERLAEDDAGTSGYHAHPSVRAHWQSIVDGVVPFGYKVSKEIKDGN